MARQKKYYCPYCPENERKRMAGQGLATHQRFAHPGKPFKKTTRKKDPLGQKKEKAIAKNLQFSLEPIGGNAASGFDAEFRLRIVLKIDVEK